MISHENKQILKKCEDIAHQFSETIHRVFRNGAVLLNIIPHSNKKDYDISDQTKIIMNLSRDHRLTKKELKKWVIENCLVTIYEAFSFYIESNCDIMNKYFSDKEKIEIKNAKTKFIRKIEILTKTISRINDGKLPIYKIKEGELDAIDSIKKARNCIVHNNSVITKNMCSKNKNIFEIKWYYIKDYYILTDGSQVEIKKFRPSPRKKITNIISTFDSYERIFKLDKTINLYIEEIFKIGIFIKHIALNISCNIKYSFDSDRRNAPNKKIF